MSPLPLVWSGCFAVHPSPVGGQTELQDRSRVPDPADVAVPSGYHLEVVATGLELPTAVLFDDAGQVYVVEAGTSDGELFLAPRITQVGPDGRTRPIVRGDNGPWNGAVWDAGGFLVAEGGVERGGRIVRIDLDGNVTPLVSGLPSLGDHHTNGPVVGADGWVYFGQGTATNAGIVGTDNAESGWLGRYPRLHDVPCEDVTLVGTNVETPDPLNGGKIHTGAFVPFGTATRAGHQVPGAVPCSGAVMRVRPDGSDLELVAWGFRNPFGLAFGPGGALYVTDNGYDVRGSRPVLDAGDWMWRVEPGTWYGWPDYAGGSSLDDRRWKAPGHRRPERILAEDPGDPPDPVAQLGVRSSSRGFDFSRNPAFGHVGEAFVAQFGDEVSGTDEAPVGFGVVRVDPETGVVEAFLVNRGGSTGPGTYLGTDGLERPVAVRFDPTGTALYVVDSGILTMDGSTAVPGTGVLWKVTAAGEPMARGAP